MSVVPTRYVIELRNGSRPVGLYLHVYDAALGDDVDAESGTSWSRDPTLALRFSRKSAADAYIRDHVDLDAVSIPVRADELVRGPNHVSDDEVDDLAMH